MHTVWRMQQCGSRSFSTERPCWLSPCTAACVLQVRAHHYCSHVNEEMRQCLIYDSGERNARLIGKVTLGCAAAAAQALPCCSWCFPVTLALSTLHVRNASTQGLWRAHPDMVIGLHGSLQVIAAELCCRS